MISDPAVKNKRKERHFPDRVSGVYFELKYLVAIKCDAFSCLT
jgi:hypothetical protein